MPTNQQNTPQPQGGVQPVETRYTSFVGFAASRIGGRSENQDTCACTDTPLGLLVLVCDGMGGGPGGKTASMIAASTIGDYMSAIESHKEPEVALLEAIRLAHKAIVDYAASNPALKGMGSTVAAFLINDYAAYAAHVGDSRIYQLRGGRIVYRSTDHSMVMEMFTRGQLKSDEEVRNHPNTNIITQALGHGENHKPEIVQLPYLKGDRFALCSDGIWGMFSQPELVKMLAAPKNPAGAVDQTVINVDRAGIDAGNHHDNLTLAIVDPKINSTLPVPMSKTTKLILAVLGILLLASVIFNVVLLLRGDSAKSVDEKVKAAVTATTDSLNAVYKHKTDSLEKVIEEGGTLHGASASDVKPEAPKAEEKAPSNQGIADRLDRLEKEIEAIKNAKTDTDRAGLIAAAVKNIEGLEATKDVKSNPKLAEALKFSRAELNKKATKDPAKCQGQVNAVVKKLQAARK